MYFPLNIAKFLRILNLRNTFEGLLLWVVRSRAVKWIWMLIHYMTSVTERGAIFFWLPKISIWFFKTYERFYIHFLFKKNQNFEIVTKLFHKSTIAVPKIVYWLLNFIFDLFGDFTRIQHYRLYNNEIHYQ